MEERKNFKKNIRAFILLLSVSAFAYCSSGDKDEGGYVQGDGNLSDGEYADVNQVSGNGGNGATGNEGDNADGEDVTGNEGDGANDEDVTGNEGDSANDEGVTGNEGDNANGEGVTGNEGDSADSGGVTGELDDIPPAPVTDLIAVAGGRHIELSWINPTDVNLDRVEIIYNVQGETDDTLYKIEIETVQQSESFTQLLAGLSLSTVYDISVVTVNRYGNRGEGVTISSATSADLDQDDDGLIEIHTLAQLDALRYDLNGNGFLDSGSIVAAGAESPPGNNGCPVSGCIGYELIADLDLDTNGSGEVDPGDFYWQDGLNWQPIGSCGADNDCATIADNVPFTGIFQGNGHRIKNLYILRQVTEAVGLFGMISGNNAEVANVILPDVNVDGGNITGGLVGFNNGGTIHNCYVSGRIYGYENLGRYFSSQVGALVGINKGIVYNSYTNATVRGYEDVGGFVGLNDGGSIRNSSASGEVEGLLENSGGLVGSNQTSSTIHNSYSTVAVLGEWRQFGGLVGQNEGTIENSYSSGSVSAPEFIGGLVGYNLEGTIRNSYSIGVVSNAETAGGFVSANNDGTITNSYWTTSGNTATVGIFIGNDSAALTGTSGFTLEALKAPTAPGSDTSNPFYDWSIEHWDFGSDSQLPALRYDMDLDRNGSVTSAEDPNGLHGTLICGQHDSEATCSF